METVDGIAPTASRDSPTEWPAKAAAAVWSSPTFGEIVRQPLPLIGWRDRVLTRLVTATAVPAMVDICGLEHVSEARDPFVLALNHTTRFEAVALPALLMYYRGGRRVHFLADWNFQMVPGIGLLYRRSGAIVVMRKSARPRFLNALKPLYAPAGSSHARALAHLKAGRSVGVYPEGTVNRDPERLLRGRLGAARLSLEAGVPVVPGGIRVHADEGWRPRLSLHFGAPMQPGRRSDRPVDRAEVRRWHVTIMNEIAGLSGKSWDSLPEEPSHGTA
jgi:1-acyl-sn-glycerol-3-phosphate acyltransferase